MGAAAFAGNCVALSVCFAAGALSCTTTYELKCSRSDATSPTLLETFY